MSRQPSTPPTVAEDAVNQTRNQTRVVIAEDQVLSRQDLREMLVNLHYDVVGEAADGQTAVRLARELRPDLVVMDVVMPELDGIEASRILTEERIAPIVLITAFSNRESVERATDAGVMAYVTKPFGPQQLVPAIEVALARFREFREIEQHLSNTEQQLNNTAQELSNTKEALETRRVVERAKGVLMDRHGLREQEAFRRIQKLSMDSRKSMREIAEAILLAQQIED